MATITANKSNGFKVTGANRIVAHLTITPGAVPGSLPGGTPLVFTVVFPRNFARDPKMMIGSLQRDTPLGSEFTSIAVSVESGDVQVPLGVFPGRSVVWNVKDKYANRALTVTISSLDTTGVSEVWHQELQITVLPGDTTWFDIGIASGSGEVTSVDVTP